MGSLFINPMGSLEGTVTCYSDPIPALIQVESLPDRALSLLVSTDSDGYYRLDRLAPGDYRVSILPRASASGCTLPLGVEIASDEFTVVSDDTEDGSINILNDSPTLLVADAGEDQVVYDTDPITLDGTNSSESIATYDWFSLTETGDLDFVDEGDTIAVDAPEDFAAYVLIVTDLLGAQDSDFTLVKYEEP